MKESKESKIYDIKLTGKKSEDIGNSRIFAGYLKEATIYFTANGFETKISFDHSNIDGKKSIDLSDIKVSVEAMDSKQKPPYENTISKVLSSVLGGGNLKLEQVSAGPLMTLSSDYHPTETVTDLKIADMALKLGSYKTLTDVTIDIAYEDLTRSMIADSGFSKEIVAELLGEIDKAEKVI